MANYNPTKWVAKKTALTARRMNNIEDQLEYLDIKVELMKDIPFPETAHLATVKDFEKKASYSHYHRGEYKEKIHKHGTDDIIGFPVIPDTTDLLLKDILMKNYLRKSSTYDATTIDRMIAEGVTAESVDLSNFYFREEVDRKLEEPVALIDNYVTKETLETNYRRKVDTHNRVELDRTMTSKSQSMMAFLNNNYVNKNNTINKAAVDIAIAQKQLALDTVREGIALKETLDTVHIKKNLLLTRAQIDNRLNALALLVHEHADIELKAELEGYSDLEHVHRAALIRFRDGTNLQNRYSTGTLIDDASIKTKVLNLFTDIFTQPVKNGDYVQTYGFHRVGVGEAMYYVIAIDKDEDIWSDVNGIPMNPVGDIKINGELKAKLNGRNGKLSPFQLGLLPDYDPARDASKLMQICANKCHYERLQLDLVGCELNCRNVVIEDGVSVTGGGTGIVHNIWDNGACFIVGRRGANQTNTAMQPSSMIIEATISSLKLLGTRTSEEGPSTEQVGIFCINMAESLIFDCTIEGFKSAGLVFTVYGGWKGSRIINTRVAKCGIGVLTYYRGEYHRFEQCVISDNYYGFVNGSGNTVIDGIQLSNNKYCGYWQTDMGWNAGHGSILNANIDNNNNFAVYNDTIWGFLYQGLSIKNGKVILKDRGTLANFLASETTDIWVDTRMNDDRRAGRPSLTHGPIGDAWQPEPHNYQGEWVIVAGNKIGNSDPTNKLIIKERLPNTVVLGADGFMEKKPTVADTPVIAYPELPTFPDIPVFFVPSYTKFTFNGAMSDSYMTNELNLPAGMKEPKFDEKGGLIIDKNVSYKLQNLIKLKLTGNCTVELDIKFNSSVIERQHVLTNFPNEPGTSKAGWVCFTRNKLELQGVTNTSNPINPNRDFRLDLNFNRTLTAEEWTERARYKIVKAGNNLKFYRNDEMLVDYNKESFITFNDIDITKVNTSNASFTFDGVLYEFKFPYEKK